MPWFMDFVAITSLSKELQWLARRRT
jgi:hypothetical protein